MEEEAEVKYHWLVFEDKLQNAECKLILACTTRVNEKSHCVFFSQKNIYLSMHALYVFFIIIIIIIIISPYRSFWNLCACSERNLMKADICILTRRCRQKWLSFFNSSR